MKRTKFTATDLENNLFDLATNVINKKIDTKRVTAAVSAYSQIIKIQALKIKLHTISSVDGKSTKGFFRKTEKSLSLTGSK